MIFIRFLLRKAESLLVLLVLLFSWDWFDFCAPRSNNKTNSTRTKTNNHNSVFEKGMTIIIRHIPKDVPDSVILNLFALYGDILDFRVVKKSEDVRFIFIDYSTKEEALNAIRNTDRKKSSLGFFLDVRVALEYEENPTTRTILVRNLTENMSKNILREFFSPYGTVIDIRKMREKEIAFIDFSTHEEAVKAMQTANGLDLLNTRITVQLANASFSSPSVQQQVFTTSAKTRGLNTNRTIIIFGLKREVDEIMLNDFFSPYGTICDIRRMNLKTFAFIDFSTHEEAFNAVNHTNGTLLLDRRITVYISENPYPQPIDNLPPSTSTSFVKQGSNTNRTIIIFGLKREVDEIMLNDFFSPYGTICGIRRIPEKTFAFIDFSTHEEAFNAVNNTNGTLLLYSRINVAFANDSESQPIESPPPTNPNSNSTPNSIPNQVINDSCNVFCSKEEDFDEIEIVPFKGIKRENIIVVDIRNSDWCNAVSETLKSSFDSVIGFDTETKPVFLPGISNTTGPHLLQLCTTDLAFLFPLGEIDSSNQSTLFPKCLKAILESQTLKKVGFGIGNDLKQLERNLGVQVQNIEDVGGCKFAVETILHESISKPKKITLSNWLNRDLTENQIVYAANDAYAALRVYHKYHELLSQGIVLPLLPHSPSFSTPPIPTPTESQHSNSTTPIIQSTTNQQLRPLQIIRPTQIQK